LDIENQVIYGDSSQILKQASAESVDLVITSPPYYQLRNYEIGDDALGNEIDPDKYVKRLTDFIATDVYRILKPHGTLYLNLCNRYYSNNGFQRGYNKRYKRKTHQHFNKIPTLPAKVDNFRQYKQLIKIPSMVCESLQRINLLLRNELIWVKGSFNGNNGTPNEAHDRFMVKSEEYIFLFRKSPKKYYYNKEFEKFLRLGYFPGFQLCGSVVLCPKVKFGQHQASFPESLVAPLVLLSSKPNDLVLDPYGGSGTVATVAKKLGRRYCSIEKSRKFHHISQQRVASTRTLHMSI
jgi:site-specific DNA-methyltransferase (cytosine-N4-specific)